MLSKSAPTPKVSLSDERSCSPNVVAILQQGFRQRGSQSQIQITPKNHPQGVTKYFSPVFIWR